MAEIWVFKWASPKKKQRLRFLSFLLNKDLPEKGAFTKRQARVKSFEPESINLGLGVPRFLHVLGLVDPHVLHVKELGDHRLRVLCLCRVAPFEEPSGRIFA